MRPASTVMLLRDGDLGLEVFALHRVAAMAFAGGMTAFPGGGVDPGDADPAIPWAGPGANWWAAQWRIDAAVARRQVVAAVRELFEETGVLLAGSDSDVGGGDPAAREAERLALTGHRRSLAGALGALGQRLRADLLRPWARWITPAGQPRRYDTYFFIAALPAGQRAAAMTSEAATGGWYRPAALLQAGETGEVGMMPPTVAMLTDLARADSVGQVLATSREVRPVTPVVLSGDGEVLRVSAQGREYRTAMRPLPDAVELP